MINPPRVCVQVQNVHIEVQPSPDNKRYVFVYAVTICNLGRAPVQLLGRYWLITNGDGREAEVQGEGAVGAQPLIAPGEEYQYTNDAIIETLLGTMRGHYGMINENNVLLSIDIPILQLAVPTLIHQKNVAIYLIGDVHGRCDELIALLHKVEFTPGRNTLWPTGDLVARGPGSLDVLRYMKSLGDSVRLVLGNHDLHLLAVFTGVNRNKPRNHLTPLLETPDTNELLSWPWRQPLLQIDKERKLAMAHAGTTPQQDLQTVKECVRDAETVLPNGSYPFFPDAMYGDVPDNWSSELWGLGGLRSVANAFTRMRFCFLNGQLDIYSKESPEEAPASSKSRLAIPDPVIEEYNVAFGHWASLEGKNTPKDIYTLDTDCC